METENGGENEKKNMLLMYKADAKSKVGFSVPSSRKDKSEGTFAYLHQVFKPGV